jgi:short-subunit dehydrogenase
MDKSIFMKKGPLSIVITGASSGIGRATALEFARNGHKLALAARRSEALKEVVKECERIGGKAFSVTLDVSNEEEIYDLAKQANDRYGSIDVWVNNAAVAMMGPFMETPMEDIKRLININMYGYLYGARAALSYFEKQGSGTLINLSSIVGFTGQPYSIAYTMSKAAIRGMSLSLRQEYAGEKNINICLVLPATVDTPLFQSAANYMGREVKAMPPVVDTHQVAEEVLKLVKKPKAEVLVGGMGIQNTLMKYFAPDLLAKMYNKQVRSKHFKDNRSESQHGNLYEPNQHNTAVDGGWLDGQESKAVTSQVKNTFRMATAVSGLLAGAAALYLSSRNR